jgi:hypothetical protein
LYVNRILRSDRDQFSLRRPAVLLELLRVPSTSHDQPRAWLHRPRRILHAAERLLEGADADPVHLGREAERGANGVQVRIDETRDHGAPAQVNHARLRASQLAHLGRRTERCDASAANRHSFAHGRLRIDGEDLAVDEDRVGALCTGQRRAGEHDEHEHPDNGFHNTVA